MIPQTDHLTLEHFISFAPSLVMAAIISITKALNYPGEVTPKYVFKQYMTCSFTNIVVFLLLYESTSFSYLTKLGIICFTGMASTKIIGVMETLGETFFIKLIEILNILGINGVHVKKEDTEKPKENKYKEYTNIPKKYMHETTTEYDIEKPKRKRKPKDPNKVTTDKSKQKTTTKKKKSDTTIKTTTKKKTTKSDKKNKSTTPTRRKKDANS